MPCGSTSKSGWAEITPTWINRPIMLAERVVGAAIEAMGRGDPLLSSISREDARKVRDEMLGRVKATGRGVGATVSTSTLSRELTVIAAVLNFGKVEFDLPGSFATPFSRLPVARVAVGGEVGSADKRAPLPADVLTAVRRRVIERASHSLARIAPGRRNRCLDCGSDRLDGSRCAGSRPVPAYPD